MTLTEVALLVGIAGSLFLADRVRKQTFDMEPAEIAKRYSRPTSTPITCRWSSP